MRVKVKGLQPLQQYYIAIDVVPVDSKRYRYGRAPTGRARGGVAADSDGGRRPRYVYHSSQWMVAGNTDHSCITPRLYIHPDSPCSGETWMRQIVSFDRVKLTNNELDDKGHVGAGQGPRRPRPGGAVGAERALPAAQIILQSMHKYKPRVHVIAQDSRFDLAQIQSLPAEGVHTFSFQETEFTTVTAYQNQQVPAAAPTGSGHGSGPPPNTPINGSSRSPSPADHEAEDRQEPLRQRLSGPRQEQVTAAARPPPVGVPAPPRRSAPCRPQGSPGRAPGALPVAAPPRPGLQGFRRRQPR